MVSPSPVLPIEPEKISAIAAEKDDSHQAPNGRSNPVGDWNSRDIQSFFLFFLSLSFRPQLCLYPSLEDTTSD
jgi:hypothetical protein